MSVELLEIGVEECKLELLNQINPLRITSAQYKNHEWNIFPFLFNARNIEINLNWENSDFKWIKPTEIVNYKTVPELDKILSHLL